MSDSRKDFIIGRTALNENGLITVLKHINKIKIKQNKGTSLFWRPLTATNNITLPMNEWSE